MKKALIGLMALCSTAFGSEPTFSNVQLDNLHYAYNFGEQYQKSGKEKSPQNRYDNNGLGYIMAAISWKESSAGANLKAGKGHHSYGVFQNYLPTVKARAKLEGKNLSDSEIRKMLKSRRNSAEWAYIELSYWLNIHNGNMRKAIASYNAGWNVKRGNSYASDVLEKANFLKKHKMLHTKVE
jgi:hypothetical protein